MLRAQSIGRLYIGLIESKSSYVVLSRSYSSSGSSNREPAHGLKKLGLVSKLSRSMGKTFTLVSGAASDKLPSNHQEWESFVKRRNLKGETVHAAELASRAKIGYDQYLLLRVLWVDHRLNVSLPEKLSKLLPEAAKMLAEYLSWKTYYDSFANSRENTRPNSFDNAITLHTRNRHNERAPDISKLRLNQPETPPKKQTKPPETPFLSSSDNDWISDDESPPKPSPITPAAHAPEELQKLIYPPTKDEQIMNTALGIFLNALTIQFVDCQTCNWAIHRKGFTANLTNASFEARTDSYLDNGQENAYGLIKVKPIIRAKKQNLIQMQESAQMVGWLMNDSENSNISKL
ncbi:hypothetical protein BO78DRAFT_460835 [Aspergillus sclerotiicarbonarius CBS 121057]|uniref:Uncharacterized protein n=1 Tax=Aspergillus sclerotiicarbonarius (strain CBS 121057 / IBT 28362) TaxID=1448318 RepID=A0A319EA66_ASPSB|nr:hypothetical protein BO78DRAFT_460835 [Aspergillus sclerotiicarbonarius CBS 121057]